jgi:hypothetical protein
LQTARSGAMIGWARALVTCAAPLAVIVTGAVCVSPAVADNCPNAAARSGTAEHLPDCRAYEQVSPVEKAGLDAVTLETPFPAQASACGVGEPCGIAYMNVEAAFSGSQGNEFPNAYVSRRSGNGWQTTALAPPTPQAPVNTTARITYAFSGDLSQTVIRVPLQQLTDNAPTGVFNLFLRADDGSYSLVTAAPPRSPPEAGCGSCLTSQDVSAFAGASEDFSHVAFETNGLLEGIPGAGAEDLYETVAGQVQQVGVLPDGSIAPEGATAGGGIEVSGRWRELEHAVSQDGSRILFQASADGGAPDPQQLGETQLYDRIDGSSTVEVSAPAPGAQPSQCETTAGVCAPRAAQFRAASTDGSLVYFTSRAALTKDSFTGPEEEQEEAEEAEEAEDGIAPRGDLYRYDLDTGSLTDLTVDANNPEEDPDGANVLGVVGSSSDGAYVYFVATGELAPGAKSGHPNLYVWHGTSDSAGSVSFIATLAAPSGGEDEDIEAMRSGSAFEYDSDVLDWSSRPTESQAYVTPDGAHLAFMSVEQLTGYDNGDQTTGKPDHEVFEYSAPTGRIVCASCDAGNARPHGSAFIGATLTERMSTPFHQPRSMSDDGSRLFFSSPDPLVPGLAGGSVKVFEYENGSAQLISGTGSASNDVFLDAGASGNDIFIGTRQQLVSADTDELVDVYDARVDGGLPSAPSVTPCQGSTCQEPLSPSPSFSVPASASFSGPSNLSPPKPAKPTREQLLARALARCRRIKQHKKRAACLKAAKRRYAPRTKRQPATGAQKRISP